MKVHVYGNTLNSAYHITKELRRQGVNAEMFLDNYSPSAQDYPWWDDKEVSEDNLPTWIHYYRTFPFFLLPNQLTKSMIADFGKCDVALVSCYGPMLAMKANVKFVFYSLGSDLNMISFKEELLSVWYNSYTIKEKVKKLIKVITLVPLQRKAIIKYSSKVIVYMGYQVNAYIKRNNIQHKTVLLTYPKDIVNYGQKSDDELMLKYKKYKYVFFMISRHSWKSIWDDPKGNDKFIRSFAQFVKTNQDVLLIMSEKGVNLKHSKELVENLGILKNVEWVKDMPKYKLETYQTLPNMVIVDNFWDDEWYKRYDLDYPEPRVGFGFGCIESLAAKSLLITAFKDQQFYDNEMPPIFYAFTEVEIQKRLNEIYTMPQELIQEKKKKGHDFVMKWHDQRIILKKHIELLNEVYGTGI